jgi:hypothetical protein
MVAPSSVKKKHTQRGGAERPAACDWIRGNKAVDLFPRIQSQAAGRCMCVFTLRRRSAVAPQQGTAVSNPDGSVVR